MFSAQTIAMTLLFIDFNFSLIYKADSGGPWTFSFSDLTGSKELGWNILFVMKCRQLKTVPGFIPAGGPFYHQAWSQPCDKKATQLKTTRQSHCKTSHERNFLACVITYVSPVKQICVFEHSVITNFNCACPAFQRGQGSGFLSEGSSWLTACMSEQRRFWRDCADAQARLNLRCWHNR